MRLAVIMNLQSPWARETVAHLIDHGCEVHAVDFDTLEASPGYLGSQYDKQAESIAMFLKKLSGVHRLRSGRFSGLRYLLAAPQLRGVCESVRPDLLVTLYGGGSALLAWASGFRPYVVYAVGSDVLLATGARKRIARFVLERARLVLANGKYLAERTQQLAPRAHVIAHYLGVDTRRFRLVERPAESLVCRIVCTRGFLPVYNNDAIIRALALITESAGRFHMTFVSSGPLLPAARALAEQSIGDDNRRKIEFLNGATAERLLEVMQGADIYVSMSRSDGTSSSLLEALACGLFPIVSDIPANRDWVEASGENGFLVPLDDDDALARALTSAISNPELRRSAAAHNRQMVQERADIQNTTTLMLKHLERAAASHA